MQVNGVLSNPAIHRHKFLNHQQMKIFKPKKKHRSEEHTSELQSPVHLVCRLLLEKKNCAKRTRVQGVRYRGSSVFIGRSLCGMVQNKMHWGGAAITNKGHTNALCAACVLA